MNIEWHDLWAAVALVMIIEGVLPFASPQRWRKMMQMAAQQSNTALRIMGLLSIMIGLVFLVWVRS